VFFLATSPVDIIYYSHFTN